MKKYLILVYLSILESLQYRLGVLVTVIGNLIYITIIYNLWKSIYFSADSNIINGLTFSDTMIYLVLASALVASIDSYLVWRMHGDIQSGKIISDLIKPIGYFPYKSFFYAGEVLFRFVVTFIPTFIIVYFISDFGFELHYNLLFFLISVVISAAINISFDFFIGTIGFYTQSVWGINTLKEVIVLLFSGALIPLNFFPERLKNIATYLPFQAIYNIPIQQLINKDILISERLMFIGIQLFWALIINAIGRLFWKRAIKVLTVNGG